MTYITGLDIGSQTIKAAIAEIKKDGTLSVAKLIKMPSQGMRKGMVDDIAEVTRSVNQVLGDIKKFAPRAVKNIYLSFGTHDIKVRQSRGMVIVSRADSEIHQGDVDRAIEASHAVNLPANRQVLHTLIGEFIVDGVGDIRDPVAMIGNKLEVNSAIIDAFAPAVKNLTKCVEIAGGHVGGVVLSPLASSRSVLSKNQKELGVVLVEIGAGKTSLSVYEDTKLLHTAIVPVGSSHVTNDLAIGMKSEIPVAETVKLSFGIALPKEVATRELVDLAKINAEARGTVPRRFVAEIIEARLAEMLEFVDEELKKVGKSAKLPAGVVFVGGGAKMPSLVDLAKRELRLSAQIGVPDASFFDLKSGELAAQMEDPEFACALGLLLIGSDGNNEKNPQPSKGGFFRKLVRYFIP